MGVYSDAFTNADGTALATHNANWTVDAGTVEINTNGARCPTASGAARARYTGGTATNDQYSEGPINFAGGTGNYAGLFVRMSAGDGYYVQVNAGGAWLIRRISVGTLASGSGTFADGDLVRLEVSGTTLTAYKNGVSFASTTDSGIASGLPGIMFDNTGANFARLDSWAGGDLSPPTATLSAASATPGTTTATIGATTDQSTGTFYAVVDTAANLSGVTAAQIKAGQKASGSAALAANNAAVSTTSPSVGVTGLSATTLYSFAAVQNNANGDSNVVTGTFTTLDPPITQSRYRWRNDDGSESSATWAAAENTALTAPTLTPKRLRVQLDATGDPASKRFKLQYRKVGTTTWKDLN